MYKTKRLLEELRYELKFERNTNNPGDLVKMRAMRSVNNMLKMPSERERKRGCQDRKDISLARTVSAGEPVRRVAPGKYTEKSYSTRS